MSTDNIRKLLQLAQEEVQKRGVQLSTATEKSEAEDKDKESHGNREDKSTDNKKEEVEEHLAHWIDHLDFLCVYCGEFNPHTMKYHLKHCPERDHDDDKELEDDNRIQDKPKMQVEETDMDTEGKAKM